MKYAIVFEEGDLLVYAGLVRDGVGFAPTLKTAWLFDSAKDAKQAMKVAYGPAMNEIGRVEAILRPESLDNL